jgi:hypothetical protein
MMKHRKWGVCSLKKSKSGIVALLETGSKLEAYTLEKGWKLGACSVKTSESGMAALLEKGSKLEAHTFRKG